MPRWGRSTSSSLLRLYFLPTYSPNLNPIERLWRHFRREVTDNYFFGNMRALIDASKSFLEEMSQKSPIC
ncbi:MAG: transposase [bacterium]